MLISTFVKKAVGHINAGPFLNEHRGYLSGFPKLLPVLSGLDKGIIYPTQALQNILTLIVLEKDPLLPQASDRDLKIEELKKKAAGIYVERKRGEPARYHLFMFIDHGTTMDPETYEANSYQEAMRISYRKLFHREDAVWMDIYDTDGIGSRISRDEAMKEILGRGPGHRTAMKRTSARSASLTWKISAKTWNPRFSHG